VKKLFILPAVLQAAKMANGEAIYKTGVLCHGNVAQGTPGQLSPRIAGVREFVRELRAIGLKWKNEGFLG
jgi:cytochrome c553